MAELEKKNPKEDLPLEHLSLSEEDRGKRIQQLEQQLKDAQQQIQQLKNNESQQLEKEKEFVQSIFSVMTIDDWVDWRVVGDVPQNLMDSPEFLLQALKHGVCGLRWEAIPLHLRESTDFVLEALTNINTLAAFDSEMQYIPGLTWDSLAPHLRENKEVALEGFLQESFSWEDLRPHYWGNREFAKWAFACGKIENLSDFPCLTQDTGVLVEAFSLGDFGAYRTPFRSTPAGGFTTWNALPVEWKENKDFCRAAIKSLGEKSIPGDDQEGRSVEDLIATIMETCPGLRDEKDTWELVLLDSKEIAYGASFFDRDRAIVPDALRSDANFMGTVCKKKGFLLPYCDASLRNNIGFVQQLLNDAPRVLLFLLEDFIEHNTAFVKSKLADFRPHSRWEYNSLAEKLETWLNTDEDFSGAWFNAGLPLLTCHPEAWKGDRGKFLLIAERGRDWEAKELSFQNLPDELAGDEDFIRKVTRFDSSLFLFASPDIWEKCFDLAVQACSSEYFLRRGPELDPSKLRLLFKRAKKSLQQHLDFVNPFLCGVHLSNDSEPNLLCCLNRLELKVLIANFAGAPCGKHLGHIKKGLQNLSQVLGVRF